jgi:hypothetical protein
MTLLRDLLELLGGADEWDMPELKDEIGRLIKDWRLLSRDTYWMSESCSNLRELRLTRFSYQGSREVSSYVPSGVLPGVGNKEPKIGATEYGRGGS